MAERRFRAKDLRALPDTDILVRLEQLRKELWQDRAKTKEGAQRKTHHAAVLRHHIARVHTVLNERRKPHAQKTTHAA